MHRAIIRHLVLAGLGVSILAHSGLRAQQVPTYVIQRDVIRGHVTSDSGRPLPSVRVAVTMAPDRATQFAQTDTAGAYEVVLEKGTGDYLVHFSLSGYKTIRKRLTRAGRDSLFTLDTILMLDVQQLAAVTVQAQRARIPRDDGNSTTIGEGAAEHITNAGVTAAVPPDRRGDLDALALTVPGVSLTRAGVSVLGLDPAQNSATLNGLTFHGGALPRGALTQTRFATSTYDPTRGGFSGAQTQITIGTGTPFTRRRAFFTFDSPVLQVTDALARNAGLSYTSIDMNLGADGAMNADRWVYNTGVQVKRRTADAVSLLSANRDVLRNSGVAADSVARLLGALRAVGVPLGSGTSARSAVTDGLSVIARLDRPLFDFNTFSPTNSTWGVVGFAQYERDALTNLAPTALPTHAGESSRFFGGLQTTYSAYLGKDQQRLTEFRTGISLTRSTDNSLVPLPNGQVLVSSLFDDSAGGVTTLQIGGNGASGGHRTGVTWEVSDETQFYWGGSATHRGKLGVSSRLDTYSAVSPNHLGSFTFNSIADVADNRPSMFTRTLQSSRRSGGVWNGGASVADNWRASDRLSFIYGFRVDGSMLTSTAPDHPELEQLLGVRTAATPPHWELSPRVGFNWYHARTRPGAGASSGTMGTFYTVPKGVIRGGIGLFRDVLHSDVVALASAMSGLPGEEALLQCVGDAVPVPNWTAYALNPGSVPSQCAPTSSGPLVSNARAVQFLSSSYRPARSWRANLSWSSSFKSLQYVIDGTYSLQLNVPSSRDVNFRGTPRFFLENDGRRPVFVPIEAISPSSGTVSSAASRSTDTYASVLGRYSDLRGQAAQVSVRLRPVMNFVGRWRLDGTYTYTVARSQSRGFDGATFGDPNAITWSRANFAPTHDIVVYGGRANAWYTLTFFAKVSSGVPFTPLIGSDVNGDGLANDQAFIRDAAEIEDPHARKCLLRQMNTVARMNGCEGPWSAVLNASVGIGDRLLAPLRKAKVQGITINLTNPLGGLDQLLHGSNLHGWGAASYPDPVLYYATSFDPISRRFAYELNRRFGRPLPSASPFRVPFRATIDVQFDLGPPLEEQQIQRMLRNGRNGNGGVKLDSAAIVRRYCGNLPDWYTSIIMQSDSLLLSRDQIEQLRDARAHYVLRLRDHWGRLAGYLAALPDKVDLSDLVQRQKEANDAAWEIARKEAITMLPKLLTRVQLGLLPGSAEMLYNATEPIVGVQYFSSGGC